MLVEERTAEADAASVPLKKQQQQPKKRPKTYILFSILCCLPPEASCRFHTSLVRLWLWPRAAASSATRAYMGLMIADTATPFFLQLTQVAVSVTAYRT